METPLWDNVVDFLLSALFVGFVLLAGWLDYGTRRIPNWLTVGGATAGMGLTALAGGGFLYSLAGFVAALLVGFVLYGLKALGAGDAKLVAAIGAWAGLTRLPEAFLAMLGGGALLAVIWVVRRRLLGLSLLSTASMLASISQGKGAGTPLVGRSEAGKFPYGVGLGLGAAVWWFWAGGVLP